MVNKYKIKLNSMDRNCSTVNQHILNKLSELRTKKIIIHSAVFLKEFSSVSLSSLSKFSRKLGYGSINIVIFLNNNSFKEIKNNKKNINSKIFDAASFINLANKVFFVGVSGSHIINKDFSEKLIRLDKWVICNDNKYNQIGNSKLLNENDVVIVNSLSLQHPWIRELIISCKAKIILFTSNREFIAPKNTISFYTQDNINFDGSFDRTYTTDARIKTLKMYDEIFNELIKRDIYINNLKKTSYNK